ncbi:ankyrin repeat-containing domain protein [Coprinopsis sp. MPI-PUGE-AT-0042]|nr:ankyrin repeat-containing domain protein [Coprinopsis sp. MPI-PUGE-AT-0042]
MARPCLIPGTFPEIAGIGVRSAICIQNTFCFIPALLALRDGKVTQRELDFTDTLTSTNLILAFAVLVCTIIQAYTYAILNYHAYIALMISWMNNTNASVYLVLYIHHKAGLPEGKGRVDANMKAWVLHLKKIAKFILSDSGNTESRSVSNERTTANRDLRQKTSILIKRLVLVTGSLHLSLMAVLGLLFWQNPWSFGIGNSGGPPYSHVNECVMDSAVVIILGNRVPIKSPRLRVASLVIYLLLAAPGLNLVFPFTLFLVTYQACRHIPFTRGLDAFPGYISLGLLFVINIILIADIEFTLTQNFHLQRSEDEGGDWDFGQIYALLQVLLLLPLRNLVEAILARQLKQRQRTLDNDLQEAIEKGDFTWIKRAIDQGSAFPAPKLQDHHSKFWNVISAHEALDYFENLRRPRMLVAEKALENDLRSAIEAKDKAAIASAYDQGADLIAGVLRSSEAAGVVLHFAISEGHTQIAAAHAQRPGPHVNERGLDRKTALIIAAETGHESLARLLLQNPLINVNIQDASGRTALISAAEHNHEAIVSRLLDRHDIQLSAADKHGKTAQEIASENGHDSIARAILERSSQALPEGAECL